ncbi:transposase [Paenibacillus dendritiformis]|uniref:transposase n=1 Tax=Paenibacillus dendritiformis TaxID=130049 RepID=UPI0018CC853D|nr:transposase [Paenibacillus dendritiformis]
MKKKQYDLNFKKMVVAKGKEIGNMTAVARQHELDPKMVLRWARELNRKDLDQLDGASMKQAKFVPTAEYYAALAKENEKLKKLYAEQALERDILKDLLKKRTLTCTPQSFLPVPLWKYSRSGYLKIYERIQPLSSLSRYPRPVPPFL